MASRLDRLFILLETGTNPVTKRAAAEQLGEAQRLHPHELHHLLGRVSVLLRSPQWDTRVSAAHAVQAILSQVPVWDPEPVDDHKNTTNHQQQDSDHNHESNKKFLTLEDFDMDKVLSKSTHLTGSEGSEYDLIIADGDVTNMKRNGDKLLGIDTKLMGVDTSELFTSDDLMLPRQNQSIKTDRVSVNETLGQSNSLSRREMNRARRKARQTLLKQKTRESDEQQQQTSDQNASSMMELPRKKIKIEDDSTMTEDGTATLDGELSVSSGAVPDGTGSWPDSTIVWPLEAFSESLCHDLFSQKWEIRHGAATALRELVKLHGRGAGKRRHQTREEMASHHRKWLIDATLRLLCVLGLDRFGDFLSDQVVAPVRETCAQALGSLLLLLTPAEGDTKYVLNILQVMLTLLEHDDWEARHGALLALKYLLAVRDDLLPQLLPPAFPAIMRGLADPVDDVGAAAASALIPVATTLPHLLSPEQLQMIVERLWELLKEQDDLAAACNSFMGLLAGILSLEDARKCLPPQPLAQVLPRLWPFLNHSSSSVRKATLQTLKTLTGEDSYKNIDSKEHWGTDGSQVLQEALRHVYQRVLIEHIDTIQMIAEDVWVNLVVQSDLELLLHSACPMVSTWLCLAMQPDHAPFNPAQWCHTATTPMKKTNNNSSSSSSTCSSSSNDSGAAAITCKSISELKNYIGGVETVPQNVRLSNTTRARIMTSKMLGLLSRFIVKPAPGVDYTPDVLSPSLCYARVLIAHLTSRSALQRIIVGLTIAHWAYTEYPQPPDIPDILRDKLLESLTEWVYYDEIAGTFTRLLHECNDYIATLKYYKIVLPSDYDTSVNPNQIMTLERIGNLASKSINLMQTTSDSSVAPSPDHILVPSKLKPKIIQSLEERRKALEVCATTTAQQQQTLNIMSMGALAGAATMLHCLPQPPQPLNPIVKPLMEAIKREDDNHLQSLAAKHLSYLVEICVDRQPSPNTKIIKNLCTFLCSDLEFTPRLLDNDCDPFNGILTLINRQRTAERTAYNRGSGFSSSSSSGRGPGRPATTEIPLEEILAYDEPEAKASRVRRRGATLALTNISRLIGRDLPTKLPHLWEIMVLNNQILSGDIHSISDNYTSNEKDEINGIVFGLQVLEIVAPSLDKELLPPVIECLPRLCQLLEHKFKVIRHMSARCIATLAVLDTEKTMEFIVRSITPLLEINQLNKNYVLTTPTEFDIPRQGAAEALTCIVDNLGVNVVPYAVLFMVPLLGRMSDQNQSVRLACNATFATLVQLLPLDPGAMSDPSSLVEEKSQERKFLQQLMNPKTIPDTELTIKVSTELRSYQQQGLNWLDFLNRYKLHGVLCDDMGLGKTIQTLCIIALEHSRNKHSPPSLVVCPPTLTGHWAYETEKFIQKNDLSVILYSGVPPERERLRPKLMKHKLVIASYDIIRKDIDYFEKIQWNYCVLDEGHIIKNGKTKSSKAVKRIHAYHRLILSGTPVQNDVLELWSLFDFLMPGFLGSEKQFSAKYSKPIIACREAKAGPKDQEAGALALESLHRQVLPFLLRRNKEDVIGDLPPKITQDYYCDLSPLQKKLYEDFRSRHSSSLIDNDDGGGAGDDDDAEGGGGGGEEVQQKKGQVFEALRYLRNVCNHPKLVLTTKHPLYQSISEQLSYQQTTLSNIDHSAKLPALKQLLLDCGIGQNKGDNKTITDSQQQLQSTSEHQQNLVSQHRALIFCQLKAMLDIVEKDLLAVHLPTVTYLRLDGSIPAALRHSVVTRFNADPSIDVLLLTTQVGGLGLNLTGADTVIFVEHDWNPMKDLQAMDRAHRIGQKKVVNVYRLITRATVEEKIMGLQKFKLHTANTIISTENAALETMGTDKLLDLFSAGAEANRKADDGGQQAEHLAPIPGLSRAVMNILPELWEQQQYDDEYNVDSYLTNLKNIN